MVERYSLLDQWGRPIEKRLLAEEIGGATLTGVRSPLTEYPGDGLNPGRLAKILREADSGDPLRYLELAETVEERDLHYVGVQGTRRRSVSQLEITVEPASDAPAHVEHAEMIDAWLKRDELADELFDILDAIGKGYSFTEIIWDTSSGQWRPDRLEWRDPRWFRFDRASGRTPMLLDDHGAELPLPGWKFIRAEMKAKSGLPVRGGLARIVMWAWMFKAFTQRDWAIFTQNFGQPVRIGKYGPGATVDDRAALYRAVANIAGDCAAIIPESMLIEFIESKNVGSSTDLYLTRSDWFDRQVSKAVLGQTATTDAVTGGLGSGKEHRQVQEDIERSDARQMAAIVNRDLVRPWVQLEYGPQDAYPRVRIGRAEQADVKLIVDAVTRLVPMGLKVGQRQMGNVIGIGAPADDDELLAAAPAADPSSGPPNPRDKQDPDDPQDPADPEDPEDPNAGKQKSMAAMLPGDAFLPGATTNDPGRDPVGDLFDTLRQLVEGAGDYDELRSAIEAAGQAGQLPDAGRPVAELMAQAMLIAELIGRADIKEAVPG